MRSFSARNILSVAIVLFGFSSTYFSISLAASPPEFERSKAVEPYLHSLFNRAIAEKFNQRPFDVEIRSALIDSARSEDKDAVRRAFVTLPPVSDFKLEATYSAVQGVDKSGKIVFLLQRYPGEPGRYLINGREWTPPETGSIMKSLELHFSKNMTFRKGAWLDLGIPTVHAQPNSKAVVEASKTVAFLYNGYDSPNAMPAAQLLAHKNIDEYLSRGILFKGTSWKQNGSNLIQMVLRNPVQVQCRSGNAKGFFEALDEKFAFQSQADGTVLIRQEKSDRWFRYQAVTDDLTNLELRVDRILEHGDGPRSADQKTQWAIEAHESIRNGCDSIRLFRAFLRSDSACDRTRLGEGFSIRDLALNPKLFTDRVSKFRELRKELAGIRIITEEVPSPALCLNDNCTEHTEARERDSYVMPNKKREAAVKAAMSFRPSTPGSSARIEFSCSAKNSACRNLKLVDGETLSPSDRGEALGLITAVQNASEMTVGQQAENRAFQGVIAGLRGLGPCCGEAACRAQLLERKVEFTDSNGSETAR